MSKITVLQGVPASGKSFWAKSQVEKDTKTVIVSRDNIRESTGRYWVPEREDYISVLEETAVREAATHGLNVIIDATNLNPKTIEKWKALATELKSPIEFKMFKISYKEAVERDAKRVAKGERSVGRNVIRDFFKKYFPDEMDDSFEYTDNRPIKQPDHNKPDVIVCDIDGTVALRNGRSPYDLSRVSEDAFDPRMKELLRFFLGVVPIIFVSGREGTEQCQRDTKQWIEKNLCVQLGPMKDKPYWSILFRNVGDYRKDAIVKEEIYKNEIEPNFNVVAAFDDRDQVVKMWRDNGVLCPQVYYGNF